MRLVIVSNRLPFTIKRTGDTITFEESVGGVATGIRSYLDAQAEKTGARPDYLWIGWPGQTVEAAQQREIRSRALEEYNCWPVFVAEKTMDRFYYGMCNRTIWPLFHYFPSYATYENDFWEQYVAMNRVFCDAVFQVLRPDDVVWVHDYHLMLLPKMLRDRAPDLSIGFFLHIPFPSFEIFRILPATWRSGILEGLLGASLIGFHTFDYTQYFLRCVLRILGYEHDTGRVQLFSRVAKAEAFPMGIDFDRFNTALSRPDVQAQRSQILANLSDKKIILSADRLDYSKGILHRLQGYERFLEKYPEWRGKVAMLAVVVPSRIGVEHYQQMKRQVDQMVGQINGRFGDPTWSPILYQYKALPLDSMSAVYAASDVALITPLRDGMNLIAKEYVAARQDKTGVLILSEMAGSVWELGESLVINPQTAEEIADAIKRALDMPEVEQSRRMESMQARLRQYTVVRWADEFLNALSGMAETEQEMNTRRLVGPIRKRLVEDYRTAPRRLLLLDYDGTLAPFQDFPFLAQPTDELLDLLGSLANDPRNDLVIVSGRDRFTLEEWLGHLPIGLAAEHGAWIRPRGEPWRLFKTVSSDWKSRLLPIFRSYADRLPGSFVEDKDYSIAWHYRRGDPELAPIRAKALIDNLMQFTSNMEVQTIQGSRVVEVRNAGINKGAASQFWINGDGNQFILAVGDDWTDEDMFRILPPHAYSIKVRTIQSHARFHLPDFAAVHMLLRELIA